MLRSGQVNYWTGQQGRSFEREFAAKLDMPHALACSNGTVALELALHGLGIEGPEAEVIVPSRTFVATANVVALCGARPIFADVDRDSGNLTPHTIEAALTERTRAVIVVHLGGWPAQMEAIARLCQQRSLRLIEDCAQAHRARINGRDVGSFADVAAFSFCQDKIMTTGGEGGMVVTADRALWLRAWARRDHGKSWQAVHEREHPPGFRWLHESIGTNGRMTEMQSAIGRLQLTKLDRWVETRHRNATRLLNRLSSQPALRTPTPGEGVGHACYRAYAYVVPEALAKGWDRARIMAALDAEGVPGRSGSCGEIYQELAYQGDMRPQDPMPVARELGQTSLAFNVHHTMSTTDIDDIACAVEKVLAHATR